MSLRHTKSRALALLRERRLQRRQTDAATQRGSVLIIVLWIAFGLVAITLYFANAMSLELRASDNRVSALTADQAIEGAARYVSYMLANTGTNGTVPDVTTYQSEAVPVGDAHFWLIGRAGDNQVAPDQVCFGLVDEASKLNLNAATANALGFLPNMSVELAANIVDWRNTNGTVSPSGDGPTVYGFQRPPYLCKNAPFETVDELRLVYGADMGTLLGEDLNRNGALDPSETDTNRNGMLDPGILEYVTVYSREPNTYSNGISRVDISRLSSSSTAFRSLLEANFGAAQANQIFIRLGLTSVGGPSGGGRPGGGPTTGGPGGGTTPKTFTSPLAFYTQSGLTADQFASIANEITVTPATNAYIAGRVNVNTASATVLACLLGGDANAAKQMVNYRQGNPDKLGSIAWVASALNNYPSLLQALAATDSITTQSYQFTADIAAIGPFGRGYRRVKFVFDTVDGTPKIVYRQDLSHLGWALGKDVRQTWLMAKASQ